MIIIKLEKDRFKDNIKDLRQLMIEPIYRCYETPRARRDQYRGLIRGIRSDRTAVCVLLSNDCKYMIGIMTLELHDDHVLIRTLKADFRGMGDIWITEILNFVKGICREYNKKFIAINGRKGWRRRLKHLITHYEGQKMILREVF